MSFRTMGWVQNPNVLRTLRKVVEIMSFGSSSNEELIYTKLPFLLKHNFISKENYNVFISYLNSKNIEIPFEVLKGKGKGNAVSRKEALCSGIIQACIDAHSTSKYIIDENGNTIKIKKPYVDDWSADGYLRWAISTGLVEYNFEKDLCKISKLGVELIKTIENSEEEYNVFTKALLSNPPVYRVLSILSDKKAKTKFEIGSLLGFKGEMGFTSIPQEVYVYDYCTEQVPSKRKDIKSNTEGDSDKYARTIANWLVQMGWVLRTEKEVTETYFGITNKLVLQAWAITRKGEKALLASKGNSRNSTIPKIVPFGMLATKGTSVDYIRTRRTYILKVLNNWKTLEEIQSSLKINNINESKKVILDDIDNFSNIGLNISFINGKFKLSDKIIGLDIPVNHSFEKDDIELLKDNVREKLQYIDHKYLVLIDLAYSNASTKTNKNTDARDFEFQTANLLTKELNFNGERLGDTSKPDVIIYSGINGAIIDTKSYKDGFSVDQHCADEMSRYILENKNRIPNNPTNEWWKRFEVNVSNFYFLFVTSFLKGNYKNNLEKISNLTYTKGAAIGVENLLYLADIIKGNGMRTDDLFTMFNNDEIVIV